MELGEIQKRHEEVAETVEKRMEEFHSLRESSDRRLFRELVFVLLSSQTDAEEAWKAAQKLDELNLLLSSDTEEIIDVLERFDISYEVKKAEQIVKAREELSQPTLSNPKNELAIKSRLPLKDPEKSRIWLSENVPGIGLKGASHFLRNIGYGENLGIASRHTLSVLHELGALKSSEPPSNQDEYREMEEELEKLGEKLGISAGAVDLVLWSMKTGKVFR